jgi:hypothetical protein
MMRDGASHTVAAACCGRMEREQWSHNDNVGGEIVLTIRDDAVNRPTRFSTPVPDRLGRIYRALGRVRQDREADPAAQSPQCEVS